MITMKDVAVEAGVSRPTVSLVLNGRDTAIRISKTTRDHILQTAKRLGYRRNVLATAVKKGRTNIIGFVGTGAEEYVMKEVFGINRVLARHNYLLKMLLFEYGQNNLSHIAHQCIEQMLAGVVCRGLNEVQLESLRKELSAYNIPIVLVDNSFTHDWCPRVVSDDFEGERMVVKHLYELGHRNIVHVTPDIQSGFVALRRDGFIQGIKDCGLPCSEQNIVYTDCRLEVSPELIQIFEHIMNKLMPSAVVFSSDPSALKFMQWAYKQRIRIPDDISVVGFADMGLMEFASPGLTTVSQPFERMGEIAAEKLLRMVNGGKNESDELVPVKLVVRESTSNIN